MPVKIRLMRIGSKKRPFYRVVAVDERRKRTGGYLELLGTYNPLTEPKEVKLNQPKIDEWMKKGAVMSTGFLRIIGKAPQRFRKPKKEQKSSVVSLQSSDEKLVDSGEDSGGTKASQNDAEEATESTDTPASTEPTKTPAEESKTEEKTS